MNSNGILAKLIQFENRSATSRLTDLHRSIAVMLLQGFCQRVGCRTILSYSEGRLKKLCILLLLFFLAELLVLSVGGRGHIPWAVPFWNSSVVNISSDVRREGGVYRYIADMLGKNVVQSLPLCPAVPPHLAPTRRPVRSMLYSYDQLERRLDWVQPGGGHQPENCTARHRVALVVPYRQRDEHLRIFLQHLHPFLRKQQIHYRIFVIEQSEPVQFNRGALMNVGYMEALRVSPLWDCFIFHDVDLLPEHERNLYWCPTAPRHMSVAVDKFFYRLPYRNLFGGVEAFSTAHFQLINGFSNAFFGWGGEDDDLFNRITFKHLNMTRYPAAIARYTMTPHTKQQPSHNSQQLLKYGPERFEVDGLNSLTYNVERREVKKLYTYTRVNLVPLQLAVLRMLENVEMRTRATQVSADR